MAAYTVILLTFKLPWNIGNLCCKLGIWQKRRKDITSPHEMEPCNPMYDTKSKFLIWSKSPKYSSVPSCKNGIKKKKNNINMPLINLA